MHVIKLVFQIKDELGWTALNLTIKFIIYLNHKKICWQDISLSSPLKGRVRKRRGKVCFFTIPRVGGVLSLVENDHTAFKTQKL